MAILRKGSRKIVVGDREYRWIHDKGSSEQEYTGLIVQLSEDSAGKGALLRVNSPSGIIFTPGVVRKCIEAGIADGWDPSKIGLLIPDEKYNPKFEDKNKNEHGVEVAAWDPMKLLTEIGLIAEGTQVENFFLDDLQTCHDACMFSIGEPFWNEFASRIVDLCDDYDLDVPSQIIVKD